MRAFVVSIIFLGSLGSIATAAVYLDNTEIADLAATVNVTAQGQSYTFTGTGTLAENTLSGDIFGAGNIVIRGSTTNITLSGGASYPIGQDGGNTTALSYTGSTRIVDGATLKIDGTNLLRTSSIYIGKGSTLTGVGEYLGGTWFYRSFSELVVDGGTLECGGATLGAVKGKYNFPEVTLKNGGVLYANGNVRTVTNIHATEGTSYMKGTGYFFLRTGGNYGDGAFIVDEGATLVIDALINNSGTAGTRPILTKQGVGTLVMNNDYRTPESVSSGIVIQAGTVQMANINVANSITMNTAAGNALLDLTSADVAVSYGEKNWTLFATSTENLAALGTVTITESYQTANTMQSLFTMGSDNAIRIELFNDAGVVTGQTIVAEEFDITGGTLELVLMGDGWSENDWNRTIPLAEAGIDWSGFEEIVLYGSSGVVPVGLSEDGKAIQFGVPEPSSWILMALLFLGYWGGRWYGRKR